MEDKNSKITHTHESLHKHMILPIGYNYHLKTIAGFKYHLGYRKYQYGSIQKEKPVIQFRDYFQRFMWEKKIEILSIGQIHTYHVWTYINLNWKNWILLFENNKLIMDIKFSDKNSLITNINNIITHSINIDEWIKQKNYDTENNISRPYFEFNSKHVINTDIKSKSQNKNEIQLDERKKLALIELYKESLNK